MSDCEKRAEYLLPGQYSVDVYSVGTKDSTIVRRYHDVKLDPSSCRSDDGIKYFFYFQCSVHESDRDWYK